MKTSLLYTLLLLAFFFYGSPASSQEMELQPLTALSLNFEVIKPLSIFQFQQETPFLVVGLNEKRSRQEKSTLVLVDYEDGELNLSNLRKVNFPEEFHSYHRHIWQDEEYWYLLGDELREEKDGSNFSVYQFDQEGALVSSKPIIHWHTHANQLRHPSIDAAGAYLYKSFNRDSTSIATATRTSVMSKNLKTHIAYFDFKTLSGWQNKIEFDFPGYKDTAIRLLQPIPETQEVALLMSMVGPQSKKVYKIIFINEQGIADEMPFDIEIPYYEKIMLDWKEGSDGNMQLVYIDGVSIRTVEYFNQVSISLKERKVLAEYHTLFNTTHFTNIPRFNSSPKNSGLNGKGIYQTMIAHPNNEFSIIYHARKGETLFPHFEIIRFNGNGEILWANNYPHFHEGELESYYSRIQPLILPMEEGIMLVYNTSDRGFSWEGNSPLKKDLAAKSRKAGYYPGFLYVKPDGQAVKNRIPEVPKTLMSCINSFYLGGNTISIVSQDPTKNYNSASFLSIINVNLDQ